MQRRILPVVLVIVVVLLAGCAGDSGDGGDVASGETPDDSAATGGEVTLVENRTTALMDAGSYTAVWEMATDSEGERVSAITYTHAVDYATERSTFGMRMGSEDDVSLDNEFFHADGTTYTRYGTGEEATYSAAESEFAPQDTLFSVESSISSASDLEAFSATGTETYDGVAVTRYERTDRPTWVNQQAAGEDFTWTSFDYVVLVDEDGLVRYESWGGTGVDDEDDEFTMTFSYSLTDVGSTTVADPDWLSEAQG